METKKLSKTKIAELETLLKSGATEADIKTKFGFVPFIEGVGFLSWGHWLCTLKAHSRGRIHARKLGKVCEYAPGVPREKGSGILYRRTGKRFALEINTLAEQDKLIRARLGERFLESEVIVAAQAA